VTDLYSRGPNAKDGAKLPSLQGMRLAEPQAQKAFEAIREWLEVRLGSRGDPYERAVIARDLEQALAPINAALKRISAFDGTIGTLSSDQEPTLPALRQGAFAHVGDDLYWCNGKAWKKVTLT